MSRSRLTSSTWLSQITLSKQARSVLSILRLTSRRFYIDLNEDGSLSFNRTIDFSKEFENRGGAKPHSSVIFDLTDPENPLYY